MAFRDIMRDAASQQNLPNHPDNLFYNLDGAVGPPSFRSRTFSNTFNREDDIMLVQFFLKKIADNPQKFQRPFFPPQQHTVMLIDGQFGEITRSWIEKFQRHIRNLGRPVSADGLVDKVQRGNRTSERAGTIYTLHFMNVNFGATTGEERWDTWWKDDIEVPGLLRQAVRNPATFF